MNCKRKNLIISLFLSLLGTIFLVYYIYRASTDVVASDYIRIINYYLDDVTDLHLLFSWEGISRIPFTFLARFINVKYFNYSVFFDRILGTIGLFIFNTVTVYYVLNNLKTKVAKVLGAILTTYISFSLISWEMILNGTGYAHFITVGLITLTFYLYSVGANFRSPSIFSTIKLVSLIIITSLLFAGSYCVSYLCTLILFSLIFLIKPIFNRLRNKNVGASKIVRASYASPIAYMLIIVVSVICFLLYYKSNNTGEALIPVGFKDITLVELLKTNPLFPLKFLLKSLASSIIGVETFDYALKFGTISEKMIYFIGFIYLIIIIYALVLLIKMIVTTHAVRGDVGVNAKSVGANAKSVGASYASPQPQGRQNCRGEQCEPATFIWMYLVYGIANYALVFLARYKFVVDSYGMSSRYGIQYMFLTIAVLFILLKNIDIFVARRACDYDASDIVGANFRSPLGLKNIIALIISIASISFITIGHLTTNTDEIFKSDYRKMIYGVLEDKAKNYKNLSDEDLENSFEFHRGPEQIRKALGTLEDQHLNIFRK